MGALITRRNLLKAGIGAGAAIAVGAAVRLPGAAPGARVLSAAELDVVRAAAEVMFPRGAIPIDGIEAGVAAEVDRLVAELMEGGPATAFRYVLRTLEWGTLASRGQRFSSLEPTERLEVLEAWSAPGVLPRRLAADSLKIVLGMAYFGNRRVLAHIGWRTDCSGGHA